MCMCWCMFLHLLCDYVRGVCLCLFLCVHTSHQLLIMAKLTDFLEMSLNLEAEDQKSKVHGHPRDTR